MLQSDPMSPKPVEKRDAWNGEKEDEHLIRISFSYRQQFSHVLGHSQGLVQESLIPSDMGANNCQSRQLFPRRLP